MASHHLMARPVRSVTASEITYVPHLPHRESMFFSEEKNQKTFEFFRSFHDPGPGRLLETCGEKRRLILPAGDVR
jgi:hypothetical protein